MTERIIPGITPDYSIEKNLETPKFQDTLTLPIKSGGLGMEWELKVPETESTSYVEKGKRGSKLTKEGRRLADYNWNVVLASAGADADLETIREASFNVLGRLSEDEGVQSEYVRILKRSFEARIAFMEKEKFWAEMEAFNSPWNGTIETIAKTVYPEIPLAFVKNFATNAIRKVREEIKEQVGNFVESGRVMEDDRDFVTTAYEARIANHIEKKLEKLKTGKLQALRREGIKNLADTVFNEERFTKCDPKKRPLVGYMAKTLEGVLEEKKNVAQIASEDLTISTPNESIQPSSDIKLTLSERIKKEARKFIQKVENAFPSTNTKKRAVRTALALVGTSLALSESRYDARVTKIDIAQALANPPTPITQTVSPDIEFALTLSAEDKEDVDTTLTSAQVGLRTNKTQTPNATIGPTETTITAIQEATTTPTSTPEAPFVFGDTDFTKESNLKIKIGNGEVQFDIVITPITFEDNFTPEEAGEFIDKFEPGKNTAGIYNDIDGNIFLICHSGYKGTTPLECEGLRQSIEGGDNKSEVNINENQRQENMQKLVGQIVQMEKDGVVKNFIVSAVGYVPNDLKDEFETDSKGALDVLIKATGEKKSPFRVYRGGKRRAVFLTFCGWGPRSEKNWWIYSRYAFALEPVEQVERFENIQAINDPQKATEILVDAINETKDKGYIREVLSNSLENQLKENGVEINDGLAAKLRRVVNEVSGNLQCVMGTELSAHLPGTEDWVDIGGLPIQKASDLFYNNGEEIQNLSEVGETINEGGIIRVRVNKVNMLTAGDIVATDSHPEQPSGHVARIVNVWVDNDGKYHALIFDVNFANDGKARLVEITDENMDEVLANVPDGQSAKMIAIRTYKSHDTWKFRTTKIN